MSDTHAVLTDISEGVGEKFNTKKIRNLIESTFATSSIWEYVIAVLIFLILISYTLTLLINTPYKGFAVDSYFIVMDVFIPQETVPSIKTGDQLIGVDDNLVDPVITPEEPMLPGVQPGEAVTLHIERAGKPYTINWVVPGPNIGEIVDRLSFVWIPFIFWGIGVATALFVRPKDSRWRLLMAFNYITAIWLVAGIASTELISTSSAVFRAAMWISIPICLHLHWEFPQPLPKLNKYIIIGVYSFSILMIGADAFDLVPRFASAAGLMLGALGCIVLLIIHWLRQPDQRSALKFILFAFVLATTPTFLIGVLLLNKTPVAFSGRALFTLPIIPIVYFYVIARKRLPGMELRANRTITLLLFSVFIFNVFFPLAVVSHTAFLMTNISLVVSLAAIVTVSLVTIPVYPKFERWIERTFMSITLPLDQLVETYTNRITTSLDSDQLVNLLRDEVFPSLLIRQAALLRINGSNGNIDGTHITKFLLLRIDPAQIPAADDVHELLEHAGRYRPKPRNPGEIQQFPWVRLALPLSAEGRTIGICLFGQCDPDDYFSNSDIKALTAILNQTALALVNIDQAKRLHALYQNDIERQEEERRRLARELHDVVLSDLAIMAQSRDNQQANDVYQNAYQSGVQHIRGIISGLRPAMLNYGLRSALDELVDELCANPKIQYNGKPDIVLSVPPSQQRYHEDVELHFYRIVQQACENALNHAQASRISISGFLKDDSIDLRIDDDGIGFDVDIPLELDVLLGQHHFGLAGMYERAALIKADMYINSSAGSGTTVHVVWNEGQGA
ncbi:MAG: ATP-binding protein [Chloroflexota bacterium]|nr:ATP-binding protein [Chloroflexota bacterium]